jgi:hypothetical protein
MKIRFGFVSNSSSSSFVLALPDKPKSAEEIRQWLFADIEYLSHPYERRAVPVQLAADSVFEQLQNQEPMTKEQVVDELQAPYSLYKEHFDDLTYPYDGDEKAMEQYRNEWERRNVVYEEKAAVIKGAQADEFMAENEGKKFFVVNYEDHESFNSFMEHGGVFEGVPHIWISHH